jgi:site-specific DNA-methyltransferase (adenine-specific)
MSEQIVVHADCRDFARQLIEADSLVDAVVCDPPYGIDFRGAEWDHGVPSAETWSAIRAASKPGAHLVAFGGPKKWHRLACAIEDAGWEIRDSLAWLFGQGFPKGDLCLKPAHEPIVLARNPGAPGQLNIDACRIPAARKGGHNVPTDRAAHARVRADGSAIAPRAGDPCDGLGRWPANVVLDEDAAALLDAQTGTLVSGRVTKTYDALLVPDGVALGAKRRNLDPTKVFSDEGGASRFFYVSKASRAERTHGGLVENDWPTVKPVACMRWLARLVTPAGGRVWDPFCGSGSTLVACALEGIDAVGTDREARAVEIARARLRARE